VASHGGNVTGPPEVANGGPIETDDGLTLETLWDRPAIPPVGAVVLCHPHPLQGGTMTVPLIRAMSASLIDRGAVVLRFNFRGVGDSEGTWGGGLAEIYDVAAAVAAIGEVYAGVPLGIAGWSFGAVTSLNWQARSASSLPWAGVASPLRLTGGFRLPDPAALAPARRKFIVGTRDQFVTADDMSRYAQEAGAEIEVLDGSDHFFYFKEHHVAEIVADHLLGTPPAATR